MSRFSRPRSGRCWPWWAAWGGSLVVLLVGCKGPAKKELPAPAPAASVAIIQKSQAKPQLTQRTTLQTPIDQFVRQHLQGGQRTGVRVVVYVGAKWCEPCHSFQQAMAAGELDEALAGIQFLEFDVDQDRDELRAAGYGSKHIPLFSLPDPDGRAGSFRFEGSVPGSVGIKGYLVPRLLAMLEQKQAG